MDNTLVGTKVLVTRQPEYSKTIIAKIQNLHGAVFNLPLFAIESIIDAQWYHNSKQNLQKCDLGIVVSKNAATAIFAQLPLDLRADITWASVGPATADYLNTLGLRCIAPSAAPFDSHALINELRQQKFNLHGANVHIFTGVAWDPYLSKQCQELGAHVQIVPVYKRVKPDFVIDEIQRVFNKNTGVDIILITCVTSLLHLQQLARDYIHEIQQLPILAVSARIATTALEMGFINVYTSKSVSEADIMQCLIEWRQAR